MTRDSDGVFIDVIAQKSCGIGTSQQVIDERAEILLAIEVLVVVPAPCIDEVRYHDGLASGTRVGVIGSGNDVTHAGEIFSEKNDLIARAQKAM